MKNQLQREEILGTHQFQRTISLDRSEMKVDEDARTAELAFSSDAPINHWFGYLILDHSKESVRLDRLNSGGAVLWNHNADAQIGAVERANISTDGRARATVKFSRALCGEECLQDVRDGIKRNVSVGFIVHSLDAEMDEGGKQILMNDEPVYRSRDWEPFEISLVSIPADISVGVGRSLEATPRAMRVHSINTENNLMKTDETQTETTTETISAPAQVAAANTEFARAAEINQFGEILGETDLARDYIAAGKDLAQFRAAVAEKRSKAQTQVPAKPIVELSEQETKQYSIARAILADANIRDGKQDSSFESEVSDELRRKLDVPGVQIRGGILIPTNIRLQRAGLDTASATKGKTTVFTEFGGSLIELLRNKAIIMQLGATVMSGLQGNVQFPRQSGAAAPSWVGENPGTDVADSSITLDSITLSPKTLQASTSYSRQLLAQSAVNIDSVVANDLAAINALAIDLAAIHGSGSAFQPTGIYASSVNTVNFGGSVTFAKLVDMETEIALDNADVATMAYLTTPGVKGKAKQTAELANTVNQAIWRDGEMNGYRAEASNQVAKNLGAGTNEHGIILGAWSEMLIGEWGAMEIITDPYRLKKQGMIEVTSFCMVDINLRHAESFCKGTGLVP